MIAKDRAFPRSGDQIGNVGSVEGKLKKDPVRWVWGQEAGRVLPVATAVRRAVGMFCQEKDSVREALCQRVTTNLGIVVASSAVPDRIPPRPGDFLRACLQDCISTIGFARGSCVEGSGTSHRATAPCLSRFLLEFSSLIRNRTLYQKSTLS